VKFRISANAACAGGIPCGPGTTIFAASQENSWSSVFAYAALYF